MRLAALSILIAISGLHAAQEPRSALKAMRAIPEAQRKNLARIEAQEGTPTPERWHFLVYDSSAESGLTEYVVQKGELVTSRQVSQFVETLAKSDVVGSAHIRIDSDKLAKVAGDYATANALAPASMNYELLKEGADAKPVWKVTCVGESGEVLGTLVLTAASGKVVSHEGFAAEPMAKRRSVKKPKFVTEAQPQVAATLPIENRTEPEAVSEPDESAQPEPIAEDSSDTVSEQSGKRSRKEKEGHRSVSRGGGRGGVSVPSPVSAVRRVTRPVRHIVRSLLPF